MTAWVRFSRKITACARAVKARSAAVRRGAVAVVALSALAGCAVGGNPIDDAISTSAISLADPAPSIATDPFAPQRAGDPGDTDRLIDEDTIRLAVTTADLGKLDDGALPWASAATGSRGTISQISQSVLAGQTCRQFLATRNAYDGVTLYEGEVCLDPRSGWWTRSLSPAGTPQDAG
ncbi:MAG: RT0821/Lpp0805 family surface protein [Phyllobacteriaceae bacterium]|nr:RT0821/Lpp0805 family surface protein [Phyllobacteriaceae bacterium]